MSIPDISISATSFLTTKTGTWPKFTHGNFPAWHNAIKYILIGNNAWEIVTGQEHDPTGIIGTTCNEIKGYRKRHNKAMAPLHSSLSPAIQSHVSGIHNVDQV